MNIKKLLIIVIGFYSSSLFANLSDAVLMNSSSKKLKYGWTEVKEQWGVPNSEYLITKIILQNPYGKSIKEFYYNNDNIKIDYITTNEKLLISTFETDSSNSNRFWKFEIISSGNEQIFYREYSYKSPYFSFSLNTPVKTKKVDFYPYFFAVDDMYLYYINDDFTAIEKKEIKFNDLEIIDDMMPTPRKIKFDRASLKILYEFPTVDSSDSNVNHIINININKSN